MIPVRRLYLSALVIGSLAAQPVDSGLFKTMRWRSIGPFRGGRATAVTGIASQPQVYYQGATGGGVWKTTDAGITWAPVSDRYFKTGSVGGIGVAESDPNVVYVGMGEACLRSNISQGDGVYKSTDAGKTWTHVGLDDTRTIGKVRVDPKDPNTVYVAAVGHPYGPNEERGLFRSRDGGKSWQKVLYVNDKTGAVDISMDPHDSRVLYVAMWQVLRTPWAVYSTGPGSGLYKTTDGGDHWTQLTNGLPKGDKGKIGVAVSQVNSNRVYATVEAEDGGVFMSDDAGKNWRLMNDDFSVRGRQYYYGHIFADTQELDTIYTFSSKGFFKSTDAGKTYTTLRAPHGDYHDLWIDPKDHLRMANANDGGATITFNGGATWSSLDNQPTGQFYEAITDNHFPYRIYGSQQDNTTVSIASRTDAGGIGITDWYTVAGGESGYLAPDPKHPDVTYGGSFFGMMTRYDRSANYARNITIWPDYPGGRTAADVKYRFQWTYPIVIPPLDPGSILAGANVVFRSTDQGQSWEVISPDLTRNDKTRENGGRLEEYYSTIFAISPSRVDQNVIWTGSDDGLIYVTRDNGKNWVNVTPRELPEWTRINIIESSPYEAGTAYVAANRYQLNDDRPLIYKTSDFGKTWKLITHGLPPTVFTRTVREDPVRRGLLYAGTERGVYVSFNDGADWQPLQLNMPIVPVTDLTIKNNDLIAATQGRAFWVLDDVTALHQLNGELGDMKLFKPRDVYRPASGRGGGGGRGGAVGVGQNPPNGVTVSYYFKSRPTTAVSIEFLDSAGAVIRSFPKVPEAGTNRFDWDLRYPEAHPIEGETHLAGGSLRGPMAVPGNYRVRIGSQEQSFAILKDPRLPTTDKEYSEQFQFLISVRDKESEINDAINRIRGVLKTTSGNAAKQLDALLHELWEPGYTGYDDQMLVFPLKLNNRIAALQGYADGGFAPTDQDRKVFNELSADLERLTSQLKHLLENRASK
ncbi:MAG TPA: hypothetical protein VKU01_34450 [Bryobacteraceae bacterium]|nr:hypothetical protein [Bryobacteraceae bacterium]